LAELTNSLDEALEEIEKASIKTTQGSFIRVEDVRRLLTAKKEAMAVEQETAPRPKNMNDAKQMAKRDPEIAAEFANRPMQLGKSIPADA
jgi:predicted transcriptional regulator